MPELKNSQFRILEPKEDVKRLIIPAIVLCLYFVISFKYYYCLLKANIFELDSVFSQFLFVLTPYTVFVILLNLIYMLIYKFEPAVLMKYRINDVKWPWELDQEIWLKKRTNAILLYVFCSKLYNNLNRCLILA